MKNLSGLECKVEERIIKLICDSDCPLSHLKEALFQFSKYIGQIEDAAKKSQKDSVESEKIEENPEDKNEQVEDGNKQ